MTNGNENRAGEDDVSGDIPDTQSAKRLDPGFKRNIKLIAGAAGAAILLVGVVFWKAGQPKEVEKRNETAIHMGGSSREQTEGMSPVMAEMLKEKQLQEALEAAKKGASYIPADPMPTIPVAMNSGSGSGAGASALVQDSGVLSQQSSLEVAGYARQREGLERQIRGFLEPGAVDASAVRQRVALEKQNDGSSIDGQRMGAGSQSADINANQTGQKGPVLINGHYIAPAVLANKLDVPEGRKTYASASIAAGPYKGAFLTGGANVVNEGLSLHFDKMSFNGKFYTVDVTGLDENTSADAIAGNVDRRILERWIMPVTMATIGGYFQGKAQTGQTVVNVGTNTLPGTNTSTGMTGVSIPAPTNEQAKAAGIAAGIQIGQREISRNANAPIIVSKEPKFPMGLIFNAPVYEGDGK